jgi:multiple antibiotic resistance protein
MDAHAVAVQAAQTAVALFVIIDPLGGLPIFAGLLHSTPPAKRRQAVNMGAAVAVLILIVFATVGMRVLALFDVGLAELRVAGGLMLLIVGLNEMFGFLNDSSCYSDNLGLVPMACPLLAGPGAIVTLMVAVQREAFPASAVIMLGSVALAMGASWLILLNTDRLMSLLGGRGSLVLSKLMGIVVTAIGTHFILQGLVDFLATSSPAA